MKIFIKTKVNNNLKNIHTQFDRELFLRLSPPLINLTVDRFDGCLKGHQIHLTMTFLGKIKNKWISTVTTSEFNAKEFYFIDEGVVLPPPLSYWKHVHRVDRIDDDNCYVIDDIEYKTKSPLLDKIIFPALYSIFLYRVPIYKRTLSK
jgi:ligand-binding SRPBCC domain-containing protein